MLLCFIAASLGSEQGFHKLNANMAKEMYHRIKQLESETGRALYEVSTMAQKFNLVDAIKKGFAFLFRSKSITLRLFITFSLQDRGCDNRRFVTALNLSGPS